jgi:hypothetical protein
MHLSMRMKTAICLSDSDRVEIYINIILRLQLQITSTKASRMFSDPLESIDLSEISCAQARHIEQ